MSKLAQRQKFLTNCDAATQTIHAPILDLAQVNGHLNPAGLGHTAEFSALGSFGQSSVGFENLAAYHQADSTGKAPYGGAEYAIVQSPEAEQVCHKMSALHRGAGAIICPSGLAAITTTLLTFKPTVIAVPDNAYYPLQRFLSWHNQPAQLRPVRYPANAAADELAAILTREATGGTPVEMIYLEAPGSGTFEIPDLAGMIALAKAQGIRTVMDNTWASHVRCQPLALGIDLAIQATTKYEGGYADTPSGVVIAAHADDVARLRRASRVLGIGAVAPRICLRLYHRLDSTAARLERHSSSAAYVMDWLAQQPFVESILCPTLPSSPDHPRFKQYFSGGNSLFSVVFKQTITPQHIAALTDRFNLFRVAESWGSHVSLVLPVAGKREFTPLPPGFILRFHIGLEDPADLLRDLSQATALTM